MPGYLVQQGATVVCAHGGQAQPLVPNPRVKVGGQMTLLQSSAFSISGCANPVPPNNVGPCVLANTMMAATRVKSMGQPLLLNDSQSMCVPTGTPLKFVLTQLRVKGT